MLIELPIGKYLPVAYSVSSTSCPQIVTLFLAQRQASLGSQSPAEFNLGPISL